MLACGNPSETQKQQALSEGKWQAQLSLSEEHPERILPFHFELKHNQSGQTEITILNAKERIEIESVKESKDSLIIEMPVFQSIFRAQKTGQNSLKGHWQNLNKKDYYLPFEAHYGVTNNKQSSNTHNISGNWEVEFSTGTDDAYPAVGIFQQKGKQLEGSFLTETGDYRYLYGEMDGDDLWLSTFDGAHAFLFEAKLEGGKKMNGTFYSGKHYQSPWKASFNPQAKLQHADSLTTYSKSEKPSFQFPDTKGKQLSLEDERFLDKVVILQLMGSWCPNCMDETRFYKELYQEYHADGLEIIALGFEYSKDESKAMSALRKMKTDLEVPYPVVHAGLASKKLAASLFPMLNHVISFPTSIFIDREGNIRKVHTGFSGPGTGSHYEVYAKDTHQFIKKLLEENAS
jgi:thiol-disulfide isomerase/thioredoxin